MKKFILSIVIVIIVIGALGGTVLAARPDTTPLDSWDILVEKVGEIWSILTDEGYGLEEIDGEVEQLASDITDIKDKMLKMESGSVSENYDYFYDPTYEAEREFTFDTIRHVTITIHTYYSGTPEVWVGFPDAGESYRVEPISYYDVDDDTVTTYEFDASYFRIWDFSIHSNATMVINYTFTYPN